MRKMPKKQNKRSIVLQVMQIHPISISVSTKGKVMGILTKKR